MLRRRLCLYIKTYSVYNKCYFGQRRYCRRRPLRLFQFLSLTCYFIVYRRCCKKSISKMWFGVLHTFHLKRAVYSRRINREIPAFVAGISVSELFKFPVVQQRCDQHHKAGTCMVTTTCATLRWRWEYDMRMEDASTALPSFFVEIMRLLWIHHLTLWQRAYESGRDCGHGRRQVHYAA